RMKLLGEKFIIQSLVDQDLAREGILGHEFRGVMRVPKCLVLAKIAAEGFGAPGALAGRADRRKGRERAVLPGGPQGGNKRAVTAHGMTEDALARHIRGEMGADDFR